MLVWISICKENHASRAWREITWIVFASDISEINVNCAAILVQYFNVLISFVLEQLNIHARNDTMFITGFTFYFYVQSKKVRMAMIYDQLNDYKVRLWKLVL